MRKLRIKAFPGWIVILACLSFTIPFSCSENDPAPVDDNTYVNDWILENMEYWYLWNSDLPASPDKKLDPESFFESLLSTEDRFSWIQEDYQELLNSLQGINKEAGFEFVLYKESETSNNVIAQILYIKSGSPAEAAGLKRGDVITHINSQLINMDNYISLLNALDEDYTIQYKPLLIEEEKFDAVKTISLHPVEYHENPNFLHTVITAGDKKIGYFIYNFFSSGTDNDKKYDDEMDDVFTDFKSQGITDLILDLRFNSGGSETSANNLASQIAPGINSTNIFFKREYNANITQEILNDPELGEAFLNSKFLNKSANVGSLLTGARVYILTGSRTASASELIINALKPYMDVFLIGDVTYGKNVGSISLFKENDSRNTWGIQPIIVKAYNSLNQSDYTDGFTPDVENKDNSLYLYPLGDDRESLLGDAIGQITGTSTGGRLASPKEIKHVVGHSLDFRKRSFTLVVNVPEVSKLMK